MILWQNGIFHSLINEHHHYHQMMTDQGIIIGFDDHIKHLKADQVIDLKGAHLYPGFVDSHIHLLGYGQQLSRPSLNGLTDIDSIITVIQEHSEDIIFEGYEGHVLSKRVLDKVFGDRFIVLRHRDYHSATVNSRVLKKLQLHSEDGLLTEEDANQAMTVFGQTTEKQLKNMFKKAIYQLYAYGVTGGHSDDLSYFSNGFHGTLKAMDDVLKTMPFRAHLLMHHHILDDYLASGLTWLDQHAYLQLGAIKIFYDGTFHSKTALVSTPYQDGSKGSRILSRDALETLMMTIRSHQLPIAIHVIGDQALSEVCDMLKKYPVPSGLHDRIIHASMWRQDILLKAKNLSLICDIQPQFVSSDIPDILKVFKTEPSLIYPWRTLNSNGLTICGGSDAPVETPHPLYGMYDAIYRETKHECYHNEECLSRYEALKLYTTYANIPTYKKNRGLLKKGYVADFTVLKEDVLTIPKAQFKNNTICMTVINEHIVFKA